MKQRVYNQRRRAETKDSTRMRIVVAAVDLHRAIGPASTTISAVAERAGVQRHTVYRHFPNESALLVACSGHFLATNPPPDPSTWGSVRDGLADLYRYYKSNDQMIASVLRDSSVMPVGQRFKDLQTAAIAAIARLAVGRIDKAALRMATDFRTWQALRLEAKAAAALMTTMLECSSTQPEE